MKYLIVILVALTIVGCTTSLLPEAENVIVSYEKPQNCKFIGREIGQAVNLGFIGLLGLRQSATNDLKNKVVDLGGDTLHILNMEKGLNPIVGGSEYLIEGDIYFCDLEVK